MEGVHDETASLAIRLSVPLPNVWQEIRVPSSGQHDVQRTLPTTTKEKWRMGEGSRPAGMAPLGGGGRSSPPGGGCFFTEVSMTTELDCNDQVWVVVNLEEGSKIESAFADRRKALRLAASMVGNNSYAGPLGDIYLFGPGDGTTTVIVRPMPRHAMLAEDVVIIP